MFQQYHVIDSDLHVLEPNTMWGEYIEPAFQRYVPSPDLKIENESVFYKLSDSHLEEVKKFYWSNHSEWMISGCEAESLVKSTKQLGIDIGFLYPTFGLWLFAIDTLPAQLMGAFVRAYNSWLYDFCSYDPQSLRGVGAINQHAPEEMVPELYRIVEFGWKVILLRPNPIKGRLLSDPAYEPLWAECERLGIAVAIHEGSHSRSPTAGADRFNTHFALHACSHPLEQMMAILALVEGGVLERYPQLHFGFLEAGCSWLPYWLWRLDEEYRNSYNEIKDKVKHQPSDYFRRQCFISFDPSEPGLDSVLDCIGSDNLLFGSDYPHSDHKEDVLEKVIDLQDRFSKDIVQKFLWDNPIRFHGL